MSETSMRRLALSVAALVLMGIGPTPARADFFDDMRKTFTTDVPNFFQKDVPHFFQDDVPCAFGGKPTSVPPPNPPAANPPRDTHVDQQPLPPR